MTVLLSLAAAACYGLSDFLGGAVSRRTSVWPVGLLACTGALLGSIPVAVLSTGDPTGADLAWGLLAGIGSGSGTAFLYRGFAGGRMGVVAPVSAVGAVLVPLIVGVATGERPAPLSWIGIAAALPGIWLVSREEGGPNRTGTGQPPGDGATGLVDGIAAGIGFGLLFAALGQVPDGAGYWPLVGTQAVSVVSLAALAVFFGARPLPDAGPQAWGLVAGILASVAVVLFLLATRHGLLTLAAVITSLYPAFTVLLAVIVLRERVHRIQSLGLLLCGAAVALISVS